MHNHHVFDVPVVLAVLCVLWVKEYELSCFQVDEEDEPVIRVKSRKEQLEQTKMKNKNVDGIQVTIIQWLQKCFGEQKMAWDITSLLSSSRLAFPAPWKLFRTLSLKDSLPTSVFHFSKKYSYYKQTNRKER